MKLIVGATYYTNQGVLTIKEGPAADGRILADNKNGTPIRVPQRCFEGARRQEFVTKEFPRPRRPKK